MDIRAWDYDSPHNTVTPARTGSATVSGIEYVVQSFLRILLTPQGSVKYQKPGQPMGTPFMTLFGAGQFHTEGDLKAAFHIALLFVSSQLQDAMDADRPAEDTYKSAVLQQIILTEESVNLVILVQSMTDEMRIVLPLQTKDQNGITRPYQA